MKYSIHSLFVLFYDLQPEKVIDPEEYFRVNDSLNINGPCSLFL